MRDERGEWGVHCAKTGRNADVWRGVRAPFRQRHTTHAPSMACLAAMPSLVASMSAMVRVLKASVGQVG